MARRGENRILVTFGCEDCRDRTYHSSKSRTKKKKISLLALKAFGSLNIEKIFQSILIDCILIQSGTKD